MAARIADHPSVFAQYAQQLVAEGVVTDAQVDELAEAVKARLKAAREQLKETFGQAIPAKSRDEVIPKAERQDEIDTDVPAERLRELNAQLIEVPGEFTVHPKLLKQLERRIAAIDEGGIDWGDAEALAFASLITEAVPIRLTGQDSERGTFAQRHLMLHDARTGETLRADAAPARRRRVVRGAELAAVGGRCARLRVRLHDQCGRDARALGGPVRRLRQCGAGDHRPVHRRRPLQVAADVGPDPPASAWVRRLGTGALQRAARALPAAGRAGEHHRRQPDDRGAVLPPAPAPGTRAHGAAADRHDAEGAAEAARRRRPARGAQRRGVPAPDRRSAEPPRDRPPPRPLLGELYYDIAGHELYDGAEHVAVARLEQLYPFPAEQARHLLTGYEGLDEVLWAQEEPQNTGAWRTIRHRIEEALPEGVTLRYIGRPWRASPSEGYPTAHLREQDRIVREALA